MTVGEMLTRMSSTEFAAWRAYYKILASEENPQSGSVTRF